MVLCFSVFYCKIHYFFFRLKALNLSRKKEPRKKEEIKKELIKSMVEREVLQNNKPMQIAENVVKLVDAVI